MFTVLVTKSSLQSLEVTQVESKPTGGMGMQLPGRDQKLEYGADKLPAINGDLRELVVLRFPDVKIFNRCTLRSSSQEAPAADALVELAARLRHILHRCAC